MSQYTHCACRDCFEIVVSSNNEDEGPTLCSICEDAGCEAEDGECQGCENRRDPSRPTESECRREVAGNAESDILDAIDRLQRVTSEIRGISRHRWTKGHLDKSDFAELCKLVDRARQHLQVIGSNSALLKE